ncbi:MAG: PIN domain-containing protein [Bacteroidales bacterium]|nr:PIN domain-containing protein [Bacteroidales bacterium]MBP5367379.1 PIN domain-containing protein [Bacteroidales bacterium]
MENKKYLLDTNILIEFLNGNDSVVEHIIKEGTRHCCMSVVSLQELYYGAYYAKTIKEEYFDKEIKRINKLLNRFEVVSLPSEADGYGQIKATLRKAGRIADEFDMLIGGQALFNNLIVVTDNIKHFELMPDIKVENWVER